MADEDIAIPIALPLFNDSDPVISALENPRSGDFRIVVSTDGSNFWSHTIEDLSQAAAGPGAAVTFSNLQRQPSLRPLTAEIAERAGLDLLRPTADRVREVCRQLSSALVVDTTAIYMQQGMALCFEEVPANQPALARYTCSPYGEHYPSYNGGRCPRHKDGTLS
jgi:hypothetical protein